MRQTGGNVFAATYGFLQGKCSSFIASSGSFLFCLFLLASFFFHAPADLQSLVKGILLGQGGYCVEWWYIFQYLKFQCVFPFLELLTYELLDKRNWKALVISCVLVCLAAGLAAGKTTVRTVLRYMITHGISAYMCIYVTAFLIGRFRIFERIMKLPQKLYLTVAVVCILVRWGYVTDASQSNIDVFITPFLIFGLIGILRSLERTVQLLQFFGRHSTYMWLIHTFWIYYYWQRIVLFTQVFSADFPLDSADLPRQRCVIGNNGRMPWYPDKNEKAANHIIMRESSSDDSIQPSILLSYSLQFSQVDNSCPPERLWELQKTSAIQLALLWGRNNLSLPLHVDDRHGNILWCQRTCLLSYYHFAVALFCLICYTVHQTVPPWWSPTVFFPAVLEVSKMLPFLTIDRSQGIYFVWTIDFIKST